MAVSPPRTKGPPLNGLRAFEAAARHSSFAKAANELFVTPAAIAQHIKGLEVELTPLGRSVLPQFVAAFDRLGEAIQSLRSKATPDVVRIAALPSIAQLWLAPRMPAVRESTPGTSISVTALEYPPNLKREQFELSIFFEEIQGRDDHIVICPDVIFPVCSRAVADRLHSMSALRGVTLLHDATWSDDWDEWLLEACPGESFDTRGPAFSLYSLAVAEAKSGAGVLIGHEPLVRVDLDSGALVAPFEARASTNRRLVIAAAGPVSAGSPGRRIIDTLLASS
jgi:LysR family glycine cleavage system transcriptional activator